MIDETWSGMPEVPRLSHALESSHLHLVHVHELPCRTSSVTQAGQVSGYAMPCCSTSRYGP